MERTKGQWYKVTRKNGAIQYACQYTKHDEYFLNGYGRGIKEFDCESLEPIEEKDIPNKPIEGFASFCDDGEDVYWKAVNYENRWWNGWARPSIHHSEIESFIKYTSSPDWCEIKLEDEKLILTYTDQEAHEEFNPVIIEPTYPLFDGEKYYDLGNEGWTWDFTTKEELDKRKEEQKEWELQGKIAELWSISKTALSGMDCTRYDRMQYVKKELQERNSELVKGLTNKQLWLTIEENIFTS